MPLGSRGIFFSVETSLEAVLTATVLFATAIYYRKRIPILREILNTADAIY